MRQQSHDMVQWMPDRRQVTVRGLLIAIAIGAAVGTFLALWPKPDWLQ